MMIPFNKNGEMLRYDDDYYTKERKENYEFSAIMKFIGFGRGRSAAYAIFKNEENDKEYYMFLKDLSDILLNKEIIGNFTFVKRGCNFGIKRI